MACAVSRRNIAFYTFGAKHIQDEVSDIFTFLSKKQVTIGQLWRILTNFRYEDDPNNPSQLVPFIKKKCNESNNATQDAAPFTALPTASGSSKMRQSTLFNFMPPKSSKICLKDETSDANKKIWSWNKSRSEASCSSSSSSFVSRDQKKFDDIEMTFKNIVAKPKFSIVNEKEKQPPKKLSLIESLEMDMELNK